MPKPLRICSLTLVQTLNTSRVPTLYTTNEFGSSTTNTSPNIPPIDPQLMQHCNSSILGRHESRTSEDREQSESSNATCSLYFNTSSASLKLSYASSFLRTALSSADMTVSPATADYNPSGKPYSRLVINRAN